MLLTRNVGLISRHTFLLSYTLKTCHIPIRLCKVAPWHFFGGEGRLVWLRRRNHITGSQIFKGASWSLTMTNPFYPKGLRHVVLAAECNLFFENRQRTLTGDTFGENSRDTLPTNLHLGKFVYWFTCLLPAYVTVWDLFCEFGTHIRSIFL